MTDFEFELAFAEFWREAEKELKAVMPEDTLTEKEEKKYRRKQRIKRFFENFVARLFSLAL